MDAADREPAQAGPLARAPRTVAMPAPDGTPLATALWYPAAPGPHPVLLMRQPYGRAIASTVTLAHPAWYAARGFVVAVQDVRGTGGSGGRFAALRHEAADGAAAVAWAAALPGTTGQVGLYGLSYQAMTQHLALAGSGRPAAIAPAMGPWDMWRHFAAEGGALALARTVIWGFQMAAVAARQQRDAEAFAAFAAAAAAPDFDGPRPALPTLAADRRDLCHIADWVEADGPGPFWNAMSPSAVLAARPQALATPALVTGGWFDWFLPGSLEAFAAHRAAGAPCRLIVGPWRHLDWSGTGYGEAAANCIDTLQADWFDRFLKGTRNGVEDGPALLLFDLTRREWRGFDDWPADRLTLHLAGDGLAAACCTGRLAHEAPALAGADWLVHDPWRPVPARGGHLGAPEGMAPREDIDGRGDVAVFQTPPLDAPLRLAGPVDLSLHVASEHPSLDISAVLSLVRPDGTALTLTQGFLRLGREGRAPAAVSLRAICATVEPGERLRLSLAGAAFPAFAVNPGTGARPETTALFEKGADRLCRADRRGGALPSDPRHRPLTEGLPVPLPSRRWIDLTTEDFRTLPPDTVAILPTAAIEQHGPHLPVSVDTTINEGIVARALALAPPDLPVLALPTLCVGKSDEHLHFPGTLALDDRTLMDQWTHVGRSVARAGVRRMVILNSHGGQMQLIEVVARRLRIEAGMFVVSAHWPRLWSGDPRVSATEERHGLHGGQIETAMMLHLAPHLVRMEKAENFESWGVAIDRGNTILVPEGGVSFGWMAEDLHPSGATGDASLATADLGRDIVEAVAGRLATLLDEVHRLDIARLDPEWHTKRERLT